MSNQFSIRKGRWLYECDKGLIFVVLFHEKLNSGRVQKYLSKQTKSTDLELTYI